MRRRYLIALLVVGTSVAAASTQDVPTIRAGDAREFVGREVTICGRVVSHGCSRSSETALLNLDRPGAPGVAIGVRWASRSVFGERFEDQYLGLDVCGSGRVERIDDRYVVLVQRPEALAVQKRTLNRVTFAPGAVIGCRSDAELPVVTREVRPAYTRDAMRAIVQGRVLLEAEVLPTGRVGAVRVLRSLDRSYGLDRQAIDAVKQWQFRPGRVDGKPVPMLVQIELSFKLK